MYGLWICYYCKLVCVLRVGAGRRYTRKVCGGLVCRKRVRLFIGGANKLCKQWVRSFVFASNGGTTDEYSKCTVLKYPPSDSFAIYVLISGTSWIRRYVGLARSGFHVTIEYLDAMAVLLESKSKDCVDFFHLVFLISKQMPERRESLEVQSSPVLFFLLNIQPFTFLLKHLFEKTRKQMWQTSTTKVLAWISTALKFSQ